MAHKEFGQMLGAYGISRRDLLNGALLAAGTGAVSQSCPVRMLAAGSIGSACEGSIGLDSRATRGGDLPSMVNIGHWMRDKRLRFESNAVTLAKGCDGQEGTFPIVDDADVDIVIVGAGLAGLSASLFLLRRRPNIRILLLEANLYAGGNAGRDDKPPLPVPATTAGAYCVAPRTDFLQEFYQALDIDWRRHGIADPGDCYYFDEHTPGVKPGWTGWNIDTLGEGIREAPYEDHVVADLLRSMREIKKLTARGASNALHDPPDHSSPRLDFLSQMSFAHFLTDTLHCDPAVSDFFSLYLSDALGGTAHDVNAHSSIGFLADEFGDDLFAFPGGASELARRLVTWLSPEGGSKPFDAVPRLELGAMALRVDVEPGNVRSVSKVIYYQNGVVRRVAAKSVIVATQSQVARNIVGHLLDKERKAAWSEFNTVPVVIANVAIRSARPLHELGLGYSQAWWGSRYWANFVVADWVTDRREDRDRQTVLTFYGANRAAPEDLAKERVKLLETPFADYEKSLKEDLSRIMRGSAFDFDRDVTAIFLYRWGHGMIMPAPNFLFGKARNGDGLLDRSKGPREIACGSLGPIVFAGQHRGGTPSVESAISSGHRAALEVLDYV
jgi:phytoene dehydrogenase-like protein